MFETNPTTQRLFVNADLRANAVLTLNADQSHYLQHVLRMRAGEQVRLFNGRDGEWLGSVSAITKKSVELTPQNQLRAQTGQADITLCCAPIKKAHFDTMIEKATELGVAKIQPILTSRTQIREVNVERCTSIATEASEQSDRLTVPEIKNPVTLEKLIADWPKETLAIVCAEFGEAQSVHSAFSTLPSPQKSVAFIIGPEGGFAPDEMEQLRQIKNSLFIRLGPRILRADTAALAALTCWQSVCGYWRLGARD